MLNLNFGAGTSRKADYINVDYYTDADIKVDLSKPLPWQDNEVDNIIAVHVIEHFTRAEWENASKEWVRILKPGGVIEIYCPDILAVAKSFVRDPDDKYTMMQIYGLQAHPGEFHKNGFTAESLTGSFPTLTHKLLPATDDTELHMTFTKK